MTLPFEDSIEDLMNQDLWTLDDSYAFCIGNQDPMEQDVEDYDLDEILEVEEEDSSDTDNDQFDWFHELGPICDV